MLLWSTERCLPLCTDTRSVQTRSAQKEQLKEWEQEKANLAAKKVEHEEIYQKRKAVGDKLEQMRKEEKELGAKLDAMRAGEGTADGVAPSQKVIDLMNQKQQLIGEFSARFVFFVLLACTYLASCVLTWHRAPTEHVLKTKSVR